jgi:hypothetical protein
MDRKFRGILLSTSFPRCSTTARAVAPRSDSSANLIQLASHPNEDVQIMAFQALFMDPDPHVKWVAAHFAFDLTHYIDPISNEEAFERDDTADREAREVALTRALQALGVETEESFEPLPPAWVTACKRNRYAEDYWTDPERSFDGQNAAKILAYFPLKSGAGQMFTARKSSRFLSISRAGPPSG